LVIGYVVGGVESESVGNVEEMEGVKEGSVAAGVVDLSLVTVGSWGPIELMGCGFLIAEGQDGSTSSRRDIVRSACGSGLGG